MAPRRRGGVGGKNDAGFELFAFLLLLLSSLGNFSRGLHRFWTSSWRSLPTSVASHAATGAVVEAPSSGALSRLPDAVGAARHPAFKSRSISGDVRADVTSGAAADGALGGKTLGSSTGLLGSLGKSLHLKLSPRVVPTTKLST